MNIKSKHRIVKRAPYMLYLPFSDMRNFLNMLPEDKKQGVTADFDSISAVVQGFNVGVKVSERRPYSLISYKDNGAPFSFNVNICFDADGGNPDSTDFHIDIYADLNFMMKMMLGSKIQSGLDKIVQSFEDLSNGRMPEGVDPSQFPGSDFFTKR